MKTPFTENKKQAERGFSRVTLILALIVSAGTLWALSEVFESDTDNDGWTDAEEIEAGTNPEDPTDPWDSDGDGIADYLEFENKTDPLDPNDPPKRRRFSASATPAVTPVFRDLIAEAEAKAGVKKTDSNVKIIGLGNADFNAPPGFEGGSKEETENARKIRYRIMGRDSRRWSALVGNGVEYWQEENGSTIGVELCAGPKSRGVKQRFKMEATKDFCGGYALVWDHYGRVPKSGTIDYGYSVRVTVGDPSTNAAKTVGTELKIDSSRVPVGGTAKACLFFGIDEMLLPAIEQNGLWISMSPNATGTLSAVVGKLRIVKICMAVDKNRDGTVSFESDDFTSESEPYRFWINNDNDKEDGAGVSASSNDQAGVLISDLTTDKPDSLRDLEDFSRLQICFSGDLDAIDWLFGNFESGKVRMMIATPDTGGDTPEIRFMPHLDRSGDLGYLDGTYSGSLDAQLKAKMWTSLSADPEDWQDDILGEMWGNLWNLYREKFVEFDSIERSGNLLNFLFEGSAVGKGKFTLVFSSSEKDFHELTGVWLELLDVREMFEQVKLSYSSSTETSSWEPRQSKPFKCPWDEEPDKQIVFVHGWNMKEGSTNSYAETSFKRLWWQNYKGRYSSVYWPTGSNPLTYAPSEFTAWKCGAALKAYFDALVANGRSVNVMAHSMGNIVVGSALREKAVINNYALMNAAIPAECYDDRADLRQVSGTKKLSSMGLKFANLLYDWSWSEFENWAKPSVGDDSKRAIASRGYRGFLKNTSCTMINFYLPEDFATAEAWEFHNSTQKPFSGVTSYKYKIGEKIEMYREVYAGEDSMNTPVSKIELVQSDVEDPHRVMAYVDSSKTKVAGTEERMRSEETKVENINMGNTGQNKDWVDFAREHSAQFVWSLQKTWKFWVILEDKLSR